MIRARLGRLNAREGPRYQARAFVSIGVTEEVRGGKQGKNQLLIGPQGLDPWHDSLSIHDLAQQ